MSNLIVVGSNNELIADGVMHKLEELQKEHLIDLNDAVVAIKNKKGKITIKKFYNLVTSGAIKGGLWGLLLGLLFIHPLLGATIGIASGALTGASSDLGIEDIFIEDLSKTLEPGTSALFISVHKTTPSKVLEELRPYGGIVLKTSLTKSDEQSLKAALETAKTEE